MEIESIFNISKNYSNWGTPYIICEKSVFLTEPINQLQNYKSWIFLHLFRNLLLFFLIWPRWFLSQHWLATQSSGKYHYVLPFVLKATLIRSKQTTNVVKKIRENSGLVVSELVTRSYEQDKCYENDSYDYRVMGLQ